MTHYEIPAEALEYFALRDTVAELLKEAGVKKHSRHAVAEVLIEAGVIDLAAFDVTVEEDESDTDSFEVGSRVIWANTPGRIVTLDEEGLAGFVADGRSTVRSVPLAWLTLADPQSVESEAGDDRG